MRIGIDIRLIGKKRTGDEQVFFNLVKNLAEIDHSNEYFLYTDRNPVKNEELKREIDKLNLKDNFKIIFLDSPNRFCWNLWILPNYLKKNPVDVFHTQYIAPLWIPKNVKLILTIHDISFNFFPRFIRKSDLLFLKMLIPRSLQMAKKIIAVSQFTKDEIEKYYRVPAEKISVIPNGVDFDLFNQEIDPEKLNKVRQKYKLPEKFILYIGTLQPRKNIPALVKTLNTLHKNYNQQNLKLVVAGNRESHNFDLEIDQAIEKYNEKKNVIFTGWVEENDKVALYKLAECFVFPSLYEGFGIPIAEAMAAGTPVACSNQKALVGVGNNAVLTSDPKKVQKLAENINNILTNTALRNSLITKGKEQAKKFSWRKNARKTLELYEKLAN